MYVHVQFLDDACHSLSESDWVAIDFDVLPTDDDHELAVVELSL